MTFVRAIFTSEYARKTNKSWIAHSYLMPGVMGFYRVGDWLHVLGLSLIGYFWAVSEPGYSLASCIAFSSLYLAFGYSANTVFDRAKPEPWEMASSIAPAAVAVIASALLYPPLAAVLLVGVAVAFAYSASLYSRRLPAAATLGLNSILFIVPFFVGVLTAGGSIGVAELLFSLYVGSVIVPVLTLPVLVTHHFVPPSITWPPGDRAGRA